MKSQVDSKIIVAAVTGLVLLLIVIGYFTFGNRHSNGPLNPEMQKLVSDPMSQGKGSENGGK